MTLVGEAAGAEPIARICWEANRGFQVRDREELPDPPWDAAPWYRKKILISLVIRILKDEIADPEAAHEYWRSSMEEKGWDYGEKDYEMQRHPSLRPWNDLTPREQLAQRVNIRIVNEVAASEKPVTLQE